MPRFQMGGISIIYCDKIALWAGWVETDINILDRTGLDKRVNYLGEARFYNLEIPDKR